MPTLYDIYNQQGKALPTTAEARFADPAFAAAAKQANITQDQYKINASNAGYNTQIANLYGKTPVTTPPAVVTAPQSNSGTTAGNNTGVNTFNTPTAPVMNDVYSNYDSYLTNPTSYLQSQGVSEANSRSKALAAIQAQVDSTNNYYADQLRQAQIRGQGNLGTAGAIQARRGLLGSDFGAAQTDTVNQANQDVYNSIENEKQLKIQELMSGAEKSGTQRYQDERAAIESGLKSRIDYLKGAEERKKAGATDAATALLVGGHTTADMTPEQQASYAKGYGTTIEAINNASNLLSYQKKQEEIKRQNEVNDALAKKGIDSVAQGSQGYAYNAKTGKYELVASNPKAATATGGVGGAIGGIAGTYTPGRDPIVDSWASRINSGQAKLSDITGVKNTGLKNSVVRALDSMNQGKLSAVQSNLKEAKALVAELLVAPGRESATGVPNLLTNPLGYSLPSSNARDFKAKVERLNSLLFLNAIPQMRGLGALTEREGSRIESASSFTKNLGVGEQTYVDELKRLEKTLGESVANIGGDALQGTTSGTNIVTTPDGLQVEIID